MMRFVTVFLSAMFWVAWVVAICETWGSDVGDPYGTATVIGIAAILSALGEKKP